MPKKIEIYNITTCEKCPYAYSNLLYQEDCCYHRARDGWDIISDNIDHNTIPKWCPLEEDKCEK